MLKMHLLSDSPGEMPTNRGRSGSDVQSPARETQARNFEENGSSTMRHLWSCVAAVVCLVANVAVAAEPYLEFVAGLRSRGYYDAALQYLDQIEKDTRLPADIRAVLPLERGLTMLENAGTIRLPDAKSAQLDQAQAQLEQFVLANPNHPRAAEANSEQANIFLGRARVNVWESRSPAKAAQKDQLRQEARQLIARARDIFQKAHDQYKTQYEKFPKFIDPDEQELVEARSQAEINYMRAQLDLAECTYEDGQTYDDGTPERKQRLTQASKDFEAIHSTYRSMVGGLYARMWQGKCFEEQGDLQSALGIYNELLTHQDSSATMTRLQDQVLQFRLICLNNEAKKDYQLVVQEASAWVQQAKARARTQQGLGIRWEMALALEQLGTDRTLPDSDRERLLRQSLAEAKSINRYAGQYKDVSTFLIRRLNVALGRDGTDPTDFGTAYEIGRNLVKQIKPLKDKAAAAGATAEQKQDLELHLAENARMLRLAIDLADESTSVTDLNQARYLLSYVYLLLGRNYESAILSDYVSRHFVRESPQTALDAAHLAMAAYVKAYNDVPDGTSNAVELKLMQKSCSFIAEQWPVSERANEARMTLGRVYGRQDQPIEAANWYGQVPDTAPQYAEAQLSAGQAYWVAYLNAAALADSEKPSTDELSQWRSSSRQHLEAGISKLEGELPADAQAPEMLVAAKVSLAQILISDQKFTEAIQLLTQGKHSVKDSIQVAADEKRPAEGVRSLEFARFAYQLLLRCYVGTQQIDQALTAMNELESIGGEGNTAVYVQLGQELEKELKRLKALNEQQQLQQVRTSFETFLNELFQRKEGQTYGSLIWIAETYFGLGQGSEDDPAAAREYFSKAATTYQAILAEARDKGADWVDPERLAAVRLRLVTCKRREGDFVGAFDLITNVLNEKPKSLEAQIEGARVLQEWGERGGEPARDRLLQAINGEGVIWGWGQLGTRLQRIIDAGMGTADQEVKHLEARLASAQCRRLYGDSEAALREIQVFATVAGADMDDQWWEKFDSLYRNLQQDLGQLPQPLERPESVQPTAANAIVSIVPDSGAAGGTDGGTSSGAVAVPAASKPQDSGGPGGLLVTLGVLVALGGAGGIAFAMAKPKKRPAVSGQSVAPDLIAPPGSDRPARPRKARAAGSEGPSTASQQKTRQQRAPAAGEAPGKTPPRRKPEAGGQASERPAPRRRPKPPEES